jgi:hypothetical protein
MVVRQEKSSEVSVRQICKAEKMTARKELGYSKPQMTNLVQVHTYHIYKNLINPITL